MPCSTRTTATVDLKNVDMNRLEQAAALLGYGVRQAADGSITVWALRSRSQPDTAALKREYALLTVKASCAAVRLEGVWRGSRGREDRWDAEEVTMINEMKYTILEDGTVKIETGEVGGAEHMAAERMLQWLAEHLGGHATRTRIAGAHQHEHGHTYSHSQEGK